MTIDRLDMTLNLLWAPQISRYILAVIHPNIWKFARTISRIHTDSRTFQGFLHIQSTPLPDADCIIAWQIVKPRDWRRRSRPQVRASTMHPDFFQTLAAETGLASAVASFDVRISRDTSLLQFPDWKKSELTRIATKTLLIRLTHTQDYWTPNKLQTRRCEMDIREPSTSALNTCWRTPSLFFKFAEYCGHSSIIDLNSVGLAVDALLGPSCLSRTTCENL